MWWLSVDGNGILSDCGGLMGVVVLLSMSSLKKMKYLGWE